MTEVLAESSISPAATALTARKSAAPASASKAHPLRARWLELLNLDRLAPPRLHPDLATDAEALGNSEPTIYARSEDDALRALAVIPRTSRTFRTLPLLSSKLRGQWLLGARILCIDAQTESTHFTRWVAEQLRQAQSDFVLLEDLEIGSPLWNAASDLGRREGVRVLEYHRREPRWWIDFPDLAAKYWEKFSKKTAANFRRRARKFEHQLVRFDQADGIDEFLQKAHAVTCKSWQWVQLRRGVHNDDRERRFLQLLSDHGAMRCYLLATKDGTPISYVLGYQWGECYYYDKVGYDPDFTQESPGTVLLVKLIDDLIAHRPPKLLDFAPGLHDYKETFGNRQTMNGSLLIVRNATWPSLVARLDRWNYVGRAAAHGLARKALAASGLLPLMRRLKKKS